MTALNQNNHWMIFVLAYNEAGTLDTVVERTVAALGEITCSWEIVIIDDCSRDRTGAIADRWAEQDSRIHVIHNEVNQGISRNLLYAFRHADGDVFGVICGDMQFDPADLVELAKAMAGCDVLNTYRVSRSDPLRRKLITAIERLLNRFLFGLRLRDYHWIKLYRPWVLRSFSVTSTSQFLETEVLIRAKAIGARIAEAPTRHFPRVSGRAGGGSLRMVVKAFLDVLWFRVTQCHGQTKTIPAGIQFSGREEHA